MSYRFNEYLQHIDFINSVADMDRQLYTRIYDDIRDTLLRRMCSVNETFKKLFKGCCLFGSYSHNTRIIKPKEFDVLFILQIPYSEELYIESDEDRPGFVQLDLDDVMEELYNDGNLSYVYEEFSEYLRDRKTTYLNRTKLQWWIHDIIQKVFEEYGPNVYAGCRQVALEYSKRGVAHTIYGRVNWKCNISIDFVPAISFGKVSWLKRRGYYPFVGCSDEFYAVPKPPTSGPRRTHGSTFLLVNPRAENELLLGKQHLKVAFRLLKSLRDCYELRRLKSYFLATMFLFQVRKRPDTFWEQPISVVFLEMLDVLTDHFQNRELRYFWCPDLNLLDVLKPKEITEYANTLFSVNRTLQTYIKQPNLSFEGCARHFILADSDSDSD